MLPGLDPVQISIYGPESLKYVSKDGNAFDEHL